MSENQTTPLWKQLLGAATGAAVALLLYGGFAIVSPNFSGLTAYLLSDFEGKIEHLPTYQRSPEVIRAGAQARQVVLEDRARTATARLQSSSFSSLSSGAAPIPSVVKEKKEDVPPKKAGLQKKKDQSHSKGKGESKNANQKRKEEKLPDTGVPLWAIGSVAFCLAMSVRYRRELCGALQRSGS